jgi:hypothetical protein
MYNWDNDMAEDAKLAVSAGFVYRHHPTAQDAGIGFLDNRVQFAFPNSVPAEDLWEVHTRVVSKVNQDFGFIANLYAGNGQANGSDPRVIERFGSDLRMIYKKVKLTAMLKVNDWGPFDYHRDFNLTYPVQMMADLSTTAKPSWINLPNTRMGIRYTHRTLDQYSPRYCPSKSLFVNGIATCDPGVLGFDDGKEWEIRTYVHIQIGK